MRKKIVVPMRQRIDGLMKETGKHPPTVPCRVTCRVTQRKKPILLLGMLLLMDMDGELVVLGHAGPRLHLKSAYYMGKRTFLIFLFLDFFY